MIFLRRLLVESPLKYWGALFILVNLVLDQRGGTNPASRFALLCAMSEEHSFKINSYVYWTIDWAQTPDGAFYSNKAPGPVLVAFPVFFAIDKVLTRNAPTREARDDIRQRASFRILKFLSLIFQALPFLLLVLWAGIWLKKEGASSAAIHMTGIALFFGNTASIFMNTYFGHGFSAVWVLALGISLLKRQWFWTGLCFGFALLSDYGSAVLLVPLIFFLWKESRRQSLFAFLKGGALPAVLWAFYHMICFGSPFTLPNQFQNPLFLDKASEALNLWGIFSLPDPRVVFELLLGERRGVLWTQSWALLVLGTLPFIYKKASKPLKDLTLFLIPGFLLLLMMNAAFGGWHGGKSPGPRYLSSVFPLMALALGLLYDSRGFWMKQLLKLSLFFSVLFFFLVFSIELTPPGVPLWPYYFYRLFQEPVITYKARMILLFVLFAIALAGLVSKKSRPIPAQQVK